MILSIVSFDLRKDQRNLLIDIIHGTHRSIIASNMAPAAIIVNESNISLDRKVTKHESPATRLRNNLETGAGLIVCPGVYDGLSARIALDVGFDAL